MNFRLRLLAIGTCVLLAPTESQAKLLSHWRFDENGGLIAADSGGSVANNATWRDSASTHLSWGPGLIGNAAVLSGETGSDNVFDVGSIEADGATQFSYSVWVKPNLSQLGSGSGDIDNKGIFTTGDLEALRSGGPTQNQFWGATWKDQDKFRVDSTGNINTTAVYDGSETEPEWIHLAFTWDGNSGDPSAGDEVANVYVNGAFDNTRVVNAIQILDDGNWQIGRDRGFGGRTFGGLIDDLAVFDQVLTPEEIALIYTEGLVGVDAAAALGIPEPATATLLGLFIGVLGSRRIRCR